jgi:hypothetical protein
MNTGNDLMLSAITLYGKTGDEAQSSGASGSTTCM